MMTKRMNNGMIELLDGNGVVVGTRPATDQDIRAWGDFIWKHLGEWDNPNCG